MELNNEILNINDKIEFEKRGIIVDIQEICRKIKQEYKNKYPYANGEKINQLSRKKIFKEIEKRTRELRKLNVEKLLYKQLKQENGRRNK